MSDYGGFGAIIKEAQAIADVERPIVACPRCGTRLDVNKNGVKNCPLGHWRSE